ncbi:MAG: HU family DNA-binding protein [Alloprevotella sp.]
MNNKDFIQALSRASQFSTKDTTRLVDSFLQLMAEKMDDQSLLTIPNVGSFEVKKKTERIVVNPVTKKRKLIPPKLVLAFRAANNLKDKLKSNSAD